MPQPDTRAWWDDVQYLREPLERKREKEARRGLRLDARAAARAVAERHAGDPIATRDPGRRPRARRHAAHASLRALGARAPRALLARRRPRARTRSRARGAAPRSPRRRAGGRWRSPGAPSAPRRCPGWSQIDRRRPARRPAERVGARPDRLALWAVVLGFFLIFVAVTSTSHAATRAHSAGAASGGSSTSRSFALTRRRCALPPRRAEHRSGRPTRGRSGRVAVIVRRRARARRRREHAPRARRIARAHIGIGAFVRISC